MNPRAPQRLLRFLHRLTCETHFKVASFDGRSVTCQLISLLLIYGMLLQVVPRVAFAGQLQPPKPAPVITGASESSKAILALSSLFSKTTGAIGSLFAPEPVTSAPLPVPTPTPANGIGIVRHAPLLNGSGRVEGSLRQLTGESVTLNGGAVITNDLQVPGTPTLLLNGSPTFGGTIQGTGSAQPTNYQVTLNGTSTTVLGHLVNRTDPITLTNVAVPPASSGTRSVTITAAGQSAGSFATLRDLTLNGNVGMYSVPAGTYRNFIANASSGFILGVSGATQAAVYNMSSLTLNGSAQFQVIGPVILNLGGALTVNAAMGSSSNPAWLKLQMTAGGLTLNSGSLLNAMVNAPASTVIINASSSLVGTLTCDRLTINGGGLLRLTESAVNQKPTVNAGGNQTITLPSGATLNGSASDDGLPIGSTLTTTWTKVSGPGTVTFANANSAVTTATFSQAGTYVIRLTASDSQLSNSSDATITVIPQNFPPSVSAGPDRIVTQPNSAMLNGSASDDGLPAGSSLSLLWTKVSGPGTVTFTNPNAAVTNASFSAPGSYRLRLTASDSQLSNFDEVDVTVNAQNQAPNVNAGADQNLTLPSAAILHGTVSDDGLPTGSSVTVTWSKLSGPGTVTFTSPNNVNTNASFSVAGNYTLQLTASDTALSNHDEVDVHVAAQNHAPTVSAGTTQTITLPASSNLNGSVSDDGLPAGSTVTTTWSKVSGPGTVTFGNPSVTVTTATFSTAGSYVLRLTASDSDLSDHADVTINVIAQNHAPVVNAGADQSITLPNSAQLHGTATDDGLPTGSSLSFSWSKLAGPANVTFNNPNSPDTDVSFSTPGTYTLRLTVSDSQLSSTDDLVVTVIPENHAPTANAGTDQTITLPASASLNGTVSDDGLPSGSSVSSTWSKVSGPGTVTFGNPNVTVTTASFGVAGTYVLRLTANDSLLSTPDEITVVVIAENHAPVANAGADQSITLPNSAQLHGTATDDGFPTGSSLSFSWSKLAGPANVTFNNPNSPDTDVSFSTPGTYTLRLTVSDSQLSSTDDLVVTVIPENHAPTANAGTDQTITLPNTASLNGSASDDGLPAGSTLTTLWTKVSGPGTVTFGNPNVTVTTAAFSEAGPYVLRLTASDTALTANAEVHITVLAENHAPSVDAGASQTITLPNSASLNGDVIDDGLPAGSTLTSVWTKVTGPGTVSFANANSPVTTASFSVSGTYELRLTASDSELSTYSNVVITVIAENHAPTANAGADQTITLPNTANLNGGASDDGLPAGSTLTTIWSKVSGPGTVTFANPNVTVTAATFSEAGTYVLRLTASDSELTAADDITVIVIDSLARPVANFVVPESTGTAGAFVIAPVGSNVEALLDNDIATFWNTPGIDNQFATLQFFDQQLVFIDRVRLQARNGVASDATLKDFDVQVSSTNSSDASFATVFSGTLLNNGQLQEFVFPSGPARARFIKVLLKNRYGSPGSIQLATFNPVAVGSADNIISLPGQTNAALSQSPSLIANGGAIYESTYGGGSSSANGLLGYYNGGWVAPGLTNQFATIQLTGGKVYTLDGVKLATDFVSGYGSATAVKDFEVWVSTTTPDAASFTKVLSASSSFVGRVQTFMFPGGPVQARYVKYVPLTNFGGGPTINTLVFDVIAEGGSRVAGLSGEYADGPNPAEAAFDGDRNSYWYGPNAVLTNVWVKTSLADNAIHRIYGVRINPLDGFATGLRGPKDFDIRVSTTTTNDSAFTTVYSGTLIEDYNTGPQQFLFNNLIDARYVEFYWKNSYSSSAISVSELEVLAAPDRGSAVVGFSSGAGGVEAALDLDPTNQPWITPNNQNTNVWFKLLLPRAELSTISHIALRPAIAYNGNYSAPKDFQLQVSTTDSADSSFTTVFAGTLADSSQLQDFYFAPVQARYVRLLLLKGPNDTGSFALHNFLIYSSDTIGSTTQFIDRSSDADGQVVSWSWNFGDGTTSSLKNPTHTFAQPGDYTVSLTVTDNSGLTGTYSSLYHVVQSLTANFAFSPMIAHEGGEAVRFTDLAGLLSVPTALRQYDFGDGSDLYSQYAGTSVHTFQDSGVFHVTLKVGDALGVSHTITKDITVLNLPPAVDIDPGKTVVWGEQWTSVPRISDQSSVDSASLHGLWDFGDGQTTPCINCTNANATVTHAYSNPGTYTATLTITDNDGSSASDSAVFTVNKHPITLAFQDAPPPEMGQPVLLRVRLMDSFANQPLVGRTIQFQLNGATVSATTDANGYAEGQVTFAAGLGANTATATFAEEDLYLGGSTYRVLPGAANQQSCTGNSTGTDFWLMFPGNYLDAGGNQGTSLEISSEVNTTGNVTIPGRNFSQNFAVAAHTTTHVLVNEHQSNSDQIEARGIHLVSQQPVTVYGLNNVNATVDAFLGLPTAVLGNTYVVLGYRNGGSIKGTQFGVVASADATTVTITPTVTVGQRVAGVPYSITLNQGQTYLLRDSVGATSDLSGTIVLSDKPIGVFGGHECANIPVAFPYCDHIVEQLPPTDSWGSHFATLPLATRTKGDTFRFLAATNETHVFLNGSRIAILNRGQYYERIIEGPAEVTSDYPILLAQYSNSHQYDNGLGDPFMMLIPPLEHYLNGYTVTSLTGFNPNLINVVAPTSDIGVVVLDGTAIPAASFVPIGTTGVSGAQLTVSAGAHTLSGPHPFGVYVYGFNIDVSYGYPGSACLSSVLGPTTLTLAPKSQNATPGAQSCVIATVKDQGNTPVNNQNVTFTITGAHPQTPPAQRTNELGQIQLCYASSTAGDDLITATTTGSNASSSDTASISWGSLNQPPTVNAGPDQTLTNSCVANLSGTAVDDGVPAGSSLTLSWTKVSGPGNVTFSDPASLVTTASFSAGGSYVLRLTASDSELSSSDDVTVVIGSNASPQPAHYFEPSAYLSYQDSPFRTLSLTNFHLEDFEDHLINTPGVSVDGGDVVSASFGPGYHDSVDGDDGVIDGHGNSGDNYFNWNGAAGARFTFDANVLGGLPTHAGLVWTDGAGVVYFEAFDRNGASMGRRGPYDLPDAVYDGGTAEDRFLGAYNPGGISAIFVSNSIGGLEIDHLQFGFGDGNGPPNVNAGTDQRILLPATTAALNGSVTDDGLPVCGTLTISWSKVSGPGAVTFANPNAASTSVTVGAPGTYVLRLTANDSQFTTSDDVEITFTNNLPPVANFNLPASGGPVQLAVDSFSTFNGYGENHPDKLLDVYATTFWQAAVSQVTNQYIVFRTQSGKQELFDRVILQPWQYGYVEGNVRDFEVQISTTSNNPSAFQTVLTGTLAPNSNALQEFSLAGGAVGARFIKLLLKNNYGHPNYMNLGTFQVVSPANADGIISFLGNANSAAMQSPALIENGGAIYSYSYKGGIDSPDRMLGYNRGGWITSGTSNEFAIIQLGGGKVFTIDGVKLSTWYDFGYGRPSAIKDFEVWVSSTTPDASSFTKVLTAQVAFEPQMQTFMFPGGSAQARYVKYVPLNNWGGATTINTPTFDVVAGGTARVVGSSTVYQYSNLPPEHAFDNNPNSYWYSPQGVANDVWVKTSLEDETIHKVYGVRINPVNGWYGQTGPKDFDIRVSTTTTDESAFNTVYSGTLSGELFTGFQEIRFPNAVDAKYVEFYWKNGYSSTFIAVSELEVLASSSHGSTLVGYSSSSDASYQGPTNALDIDPTNYPWLTASGQNTDQWLKLMLPNGDLSTIDHVALLPGVIYYGYNGNQDLSVAPKDFEVQVSTTDAEDASFTTVVSGTLTATLTLQNFYFTPVQARYVRLLLKNNYGSDKIALHAFYVYAANRGSMNARFIDQSTDPDGQVVSWNWDFGDGGTSALPNPLHHFTSAGAYTVALTVTDNNGSSASHQMIYNAATPLTVDFTTSPILAHEGGEYVRFTDLTKLLVQKNSNRSWDFGNGATPVSIYTQEYPYQYPDSGTFNVTMKLGDLSGIQYVVTKPVTVLNMPPSVTVQAGKTIVWGEQWTNAPQMSDQSSIDAQTLRGVWDFGDGQTSVCLNCTNATGTITHSYNLPGVYNATLSVTDKDGGVGTATATYNVNKRPTAFVVQGPPAQTNGNPLVIHAQLLDTFGNLPLSGKPVQFILNGASFSATTGADGVAKVTVPLPAGTKIDIITATFAGDSLYANCGGVGVPITAGGTPPSGTPSSMGTDYWLMFPQSYQGSQYLFISAPVATTGTVSIPGNNFTQNFSVQANVALRVQLPYTETYESDAVSQHGIHVTSQLPIAVYGMNQRAFTSDAYLGLPVNALGTDHYVLTYSNMGFAPSSEFGVVATQNATTVTITPAVTTGSRQAGVPYNVVLNQGQTYLLQNTVPNKTADLTGSRVTADKPVAVFGAHMAATIPEEVICCADHLVEQLPPTSTWGKRFATIPIATRTKGDFFRFIASQDGTNIYLNGSLTASLNHGEWVERIIKNPAEIIATQPIMVAQMATSIYFDYPSTGKADPFMMIIPPYSQFLNHYTVSTPPTGFEINYVNVVAPTSQIGSVTLDGSPIPAGGFTPIGVSGYSGAQIPIGLGSHSFDGPGSFGVFVYGFAQDEGYGYPGGMNLNPTIQSVNVALAPEASDRPINYQACITATVTDQDQLALGGRTINFTVTGSNPSTSSATTDAAGHAPFCYTGTNLGSDLITATVDSTSGTASIQWKTDVPNSPPVVNAGVDQTISLPAPASLQGSVFDDGLPASTLNISWSKLSGPGSVTFANSSVAVTTATFGTDGVYVLRLTASDTAASAFDDVQVTVNPTPTNQPPTANAGPDLSAAIKGNLILNGGNEQPLVNGEIPGWTEEQGTTWTQGNSTITGLPDAHRGQHFFYVGADGAQYAELRQDVDVSAFAANIATGAQQFEFQTWVRALAEFPYPDHPGIVVEFRNAQNNGILGTMESGNGYAINNWYLTETLQAAPVGTGWIRVRLIAARSMPGLNDAYFDSVSLRAVGSAAVKLSGATADDGLPYASTVTSHWDFVSGPGAVAFTSANTTVCGASFTTSGTYVLRLTASDSQASASDDVTVTVYAANQAPVVNSGTSQTITLPAAATLEGIFTDDGLPNGSSVSTIWKKYQGPGMVTFSNPTAASTTASFSTPGFYVLTFDVDDSEYLTRANFYVSVSGAPDNQPPTVSAGSDQAITLPTDTVTLNGSAADDGLPTGGSLSTVWTKVSGPGSVTFGNANSAVTTAQFSATGTYILRLTASDSQYSASDDVSVTLSAAGQPNQPPTVNAGADQTTSLSSGAQLNGSASDDGLPVGSNLTTTWSKLSGPGTVTFMNANVTVTGAQFSATGVYVLRLTASDSALSAYDELTVTVTDEVPPPTVQITAPADGDSVTDQTIVTGSVSGGSWVLEYSLASDDNTANRVWTTFGSGSGATSGTLGMLDPTMMLNGLFTIRLSATDSYGQTSRTSISVIVERNLKVGNFNVSFTDLSIPVAGVSMEVGRTYDTRDKRVGDFGFGWTLGLKNIRVEKAGVIGLKWYETASQDVFPNYCLQPLGSNVVSVTFPGGKVFKFKATTTPQCQRFAPITSGTVSFTPQPGTHGTLQVVGSADFQIDGSVPGPVNLVGFGGGVDIFNSFVFKFTAEDGTAYIIDQRSGLQSLSDPNGNTLTISAGGIVHSSGKSITFSRDGLGRITSITDPNGNSQTYTYDTNGDLVSYTDAENNTSTYTYDATHRLLTIKDPRGIQPMRNDYDAAGRLISHTDGFGKVFTYNHDIAARIETLTDRLGHTTTFEYDDRGNVLHKTDALGGVTARTYDANDNVLTETNALGKTTIYTYDANDHQTSITDPLGNVTRLTYNLLGKVLTTTDALGHVTTNTYNAAGKLLTTEDPLHNITTLVYSVFDGQLISRTDALNKVTNYEYTSNYLTKETDALGNKTTFTYDSNGNRASQTVTRTNAQGQLETITTSYEYDKLNRPKKTTFADGSFTQVEYNSIGQKSATVDQLGHRTEFTYDNMGRPTKTSYPDGTFEETTYDAEGRRLTSKDRAGHGTSYTSDELGRLSRTTFADGTFTQISYDAADRILTTTDARGNVTRYFYDDGGRKTKVRNALTQETTFTYDANGNQLTMTDALTHTTDYEYDLNNRLTKTIYADTTFDSVSFDALGRNVSKTDQAGKTTQFTYDALGRLTKVKDALNQETTYGYNEIGEQISQTDANNHTTRFEFDQLGRRVKRILPGGQFETYAYDNGGNLQSGIDFNGKTTTFAYDTMRRLLSKTPDASLNQPTISFSYNSSGQRATMNDASGATVYSYDARNRLSSKQTPFGTLSYTYNESGGLLTTRSSNANGVSVDYGYDALNRMSTVKDNNLAALNGGVTNYTYDTVGNLQSYQYPNGVTTSYAYTSLNRLATMTVGTPVTALASYSYTLGAAGNRTAVTELGGRTVNYTYDDLYRLTSETIANDAHGVNGNAGYSYDPVGNRLNRSSSIAPVPSQSSTYDPNDRLTSDTYDNNGNTTAANSNSYSYDFENHLTSLNGGSVTYVYDGDGSRVGKTVAGMTTNYLVDTNNPTGYAQVVEELRGGVVFEQFTYGHDLISQHCPVTSAYPISFYGYDGHGSVRLLTNAGGAITDAYDYDAFGNLVYRSGTTPNDYLYSGEKLDANLGFYYLRDRYMNPDTGRFLTQDVHQGSPYDPVSLHKYLYANADPVGNIDPSGRFSIGELAQTMVIQGIISAAISGILSYAVNRNFKKALADAGAGFIVGALLGGLAYGVKAIILARAAGALAIAGGDVVIASDKLRYLLLLDAGKAKGFELLGYTLENADDAERLLAASRPLITQEMQTAVTEYGTKYLVTMEIVGANGRQGIIEVVWQVDHGTTIYRLITAIAKPF